MIAATVGQGAKGASERTVDPHQVMELTTQRRDGLALRRGRVDYSAARLMRLFPFALDTLALDTLCSRVVSSTVLLSLAIVEMFRITSQDTLHISHQHFTCSLSILARKTERFGQRVQPCRSSQPDEHRSHRSGVHRSSSANGLLRK